MNSIELAHHWRRQVRNNCADSIRARRRYAKMYGENSALVNYFEGKESAYREGIQILEYMNLSIRRYLMETEAKVDAALFVDHFVTRRKDGDHVLTRRQKKWRSEKVAS